MHETERNRLERRIQVLALAASDMSQAQAAAEALVDEAGMYLSRALETAIIVCYARSYSRSNTVGCLAKDEAPDDAHLRALHEELLALRDKAHAHTDKASGRSALAEYEAAPGAPLGFGEVWSSINRDYLPGIVELCLAQHDRFIQKAAELQHRLDRPPP